MSSYKKQRALDKKRRRRELKKKLAPPSFLPPDAEIFYGPRGGRKMSQILLEFVEPYRDSATTEESLQKLLTVAMIAWNAAMLSPSERQRLIQKTAETLPAEVRGDLQAILESLIARKEKHFSHCRRSILSFELTMRSAGPHLTVLSTLEAI
jgi:hypothetical protein